MLLYTTLPDISNLFVSVTWHDATHVTTTWPPAQCSYLFPFLDLRSWVEIIVTYVTLCAEIKWLLAIICPYLLCLVFVLVCVYMINVFYWCTFNVIFSPSNRRSQVIGFPLWPVQRYFHFFFSFKRLFPNKKKFAPVYIAKKFTPVLPRNCILS